MFALNVSIYRIRLLPQANFMLFAHRKHLNRFYHLTTINLEAFH